MKTIFPRTISALLAGAILLMLNQLSLAGVDIIFDNGAPLTSTQGFQSDDNVSQIFAVPVQINSAKVATSIQWTGVYDGPVPATDDFVIEVYTNTNDGLPSNGPPRARFHVGNNVNRIPFVNNFLYTATIDFGINANETYWICIRDQNNAPGNFSWTGTGGSGINNYRSANGGATWIEGGNFLFTLVLSGDDPPAVFDNGAEITSTQGFFSDDSASQIFAVPVQLSSTKTVSNVQWTGLYDGPVPPTDDFSIQIYADENGLPVGGSPLATFNIGNDVVRLPITGSSFFYTATIDFLMKANETYWITVHDQNSAPGTFSWAGSGGTGVNNSVSFNGGASWGQGGSFLFFLLLYGTDTVDAATNDDWNSTTGIFDNDFPVTVEGFNFGATTQADEQQLENTGSTVWWFVDFPADGTATIDTFSSSYDTQLHIFTGFEMGFPNLDPVVNNDDSNGTFQSRVEFPVNAGQCYEIRVGGFRDFTTSIASQGCIVLNVAFEESKDVLLGDINCDGVVNLLDVGPFVDLITAGGFSVKADINEDGVVNLLDVQPFVALLAGG